MKKLFATVAFASLVASTAAMFAPAAFAASSDLSEQQKMYFNPNENWPRPPEAQYGSDAFSQPVPTTHSTRRHAQVSHQHTQHKQPVQSDGSAD
jgi:hypothetical protein